MAHEFTTIRTSDLIDFLCDAVDMARASTAPAPWQNAISAAWDELLQLDAISYDLAAFAIRVESASRPGRFYEANSERQRRASAARIGAAQAATIQAEVDELFPPRVAA
jgi:hypothetical protein